MKITSRDNQKLKNARKTRDGKIEDLVFVEGLRLAEECLRSNVKIIEAFFTVAFTQKDRGADLVNRLNAAKIVASEVSDQILASISDTKNSQGIVLIAEKPETGKAGLEKSLVENQSEPALFVLLHEINNPSNLGAILRTAEAAGVSGMILTNGSADAFSPKALRASLGAAFRVSIWENVDFSDALEWALKKNLKTICADVNAKQSFQNVDWKKPKLIVFGSESHGLSADEILQIGESFTIPMENNVESLNLAVSCGIILFEAKRHIGK